jgi:hypothetical protein
MRVPPPTTNFFVIPLSLTDNQRTAAVHGPRHDGTSPRDLGEWLKF